MHGLLGRIEAAEEADERGEHAARVRAIDRLDLLAHMLACCVTHGRVISRDSYCASNTLIGRTSIEPVRAEGMREATWMASFRSFALMR